MSSNSGKILHLPGIHELFPEYLSQPPSTSNVTGGPHYAESHYSPQAQRLPFTRPGEGLSALTSTLNYPDDNRPRTLRGTSVSQPLAVPPASVDGPSHFPLSEQIAPLQHRHDDDDDQHGNPAPFSCSKDIPTGQDHPAVPLNVSQGTEHPPSLPDDPENIIDEDTTSTPPLPGGPRKHICPICSKSFNRPSSLKIHYNTHTGATPFRCPWPKCGREFNVNSNMRRHYRNHSVDADNESQDYIDYSLRRRRRRSFPSPPNSFLSLPVTRCQAEETPDGELHDHRTSAYTPHAPEKPHQYSQYRIYGYRKDYDRVDMDDVDAYVVSEDSHHSGSPPLPLMRASQTIAEPRGGEKPVSQYPEASAQQECSLHPQYSRSSTSSSNMRLRAITPGSSFHSSSPSLSPSPSLSANAYPYDSPPLPTLMSPVNSFAVSSRAHGTSPHYQYSPSMPYLKGSGGSHVSTALRPAFENNRQ